MSNPSSFVYASLCSSPLTSTCPPIQTLVDLCRLLPQTRVPELVISLVALAVLIVVKEINTCYRQKLPMPIPIELVVVSPSTHFSLTLNVCSVNSPVGGVLTPL